MGVTNASACWPKAAGRVGEVLKQTGRQASRIGLRSEHFLRRPSTTSTPKAKQDIFPYKVVRVGRRYRVTRPHLFEALGLESEGTTAADSDEATGPDAQRGTGTPETGCAAGDIAYLVVPLPARRVLDVVRETSA
jgi:hypothetical protein